MPTNGLVVIETHPVQYHAPVFRVVQSMGVPVTAIYGSDFSVTGYRDAEFGTSFAWDTDLLSGYSTRFLSRVQQGGARTASETSARGLSRVLTEIRPDAVLLLGYSTAFYRRALLRLLRCDLPLLFRAETTDHAVQRTDAKASVRDAFLKLLYGRCERLLYIGEQSLSHYRRLGVARQKLIFSPYCVDMTPFDCGESARHRYRPEFRSRLGLDDNEIAVLFSGKLVTRKGVDLLVEAVRALPEQVRNRIVLLFLGDGELRPTLETMTKIEPEVKARWLGFHNQRELSQYFHAADVLVLPSRRGETWGLVINEALHHGLAAIVTDAVGCAPDLIVSGATGEICLTDSAESLSAAMLKFISWYGNNRQQRERCRAQVAPYSVEAAAAGIVSAYQSVVLSTASV